MDLPGGETVGSRVCPESARRLRVEFEGTTEYIRSPL